MRTGVLVVTLLLVPRVAAAASDADIQAIIDAFELGGDADAVREGLAVAKATPLHCERALVDSEYDAVFSRMTRSCTATYPLDDAQTCKFAAATALFYSREDTLKFGDDSGFTYEITCNHRVLTGEWHPYTGSSIVADDGVWTMTARDDGLAGNTWSIQLTWQKQPPDVGNPSQWAEAVFVPVEEIEAAIDRVVAGLSGDDPEATRSVVAGEAETAISTVQAFPALPGNELLAAEVTWLEATLADLDHGDLRHLVDRAGPNASAKKSFQKKTKAIMKRWKKAVARRDRKLTKAINAFQAAHPDE